MFSQKNKGSGLCYTLSMENIKAIIFDIGGVVTLGSFQELYKNFSGRVGIDVQLIDNYHQENWSDLILGNITLEQFFEAFKKAGAGKGVDLQSIWIEEMLKVRTINTQLLKAIDLLRKNYTIGVLSNLTFSRMVVDERMGIYKHFDFLVLSCVEHLKKPDPEFYNLALKKAGVTAEQAVFVDDKDRNTIAAKEIGLKEILFTDNDTFIEDLKKLGVEII